MRKWIINKMGLSYTSKIFGWNFKKHLRVVNILIPLLVIGGLWNVLTEGFTLIDALMLVPFFAVAIYVSFIFKIKDSDYELLDWEQKVQYTKIPDYLVNTKERKELMKRWKEKFEGSEKFVEAWRFFFPLICILAALVIYWIFGSPEAGFPDRRFF